MIDAQNVRNELRKISSNARAKSSMTFFKTGKSGYAADDRFIGVSVPNCRAVSKEFKDLEFGEIKKLLDSKVHEEREVALFILKFKHAKASDQEKKKISEFYLKNLKQVNNWNLVDGSADSLLGPYLSSSKEDLLLKFAQSKNLWERRIAMVATYYFIKQGDFKDALRIAEILLEDKEDLIQKAVGWMLREVGKKCSEEELVKFLRKHYSKMSRTTLRYAIERFPEERRKNYLKGKF